MSHLVPDHNALSVLYLLWVRLDPFLHEVVSHLLWHLGKDLFGQSHRVAIESVKWHKLYDIAVSIPVELWGEQRGDISIQGLHLFEISRANAHYNDWEGEIWASHDLINSVLKIVDHSIGQDEANGVSLVLLRDLLDLVFAETVDVVKDTWEMGWAVKLNFVEWSEIGIENTLHTAHFWVENVSV